MVAEVSKGDHMSTITQEQFAMEVFLICENVDLGYHVQGAFVSKDEADAVADAKNKEHVKVKVAQYIALGYTEEQAKVENQKGPFFVEAVELSGALST